MSQVVRGAEDPGFLADARSAIRVLLDRPLLPLMSLIMWSAPTFLPPAFGVIVFPITVFLVGYPGTERLWLLRGMRGEPFSIDQAFRLTWGYIGRFIRLGLLIGTPMSLVLVIVWAATRSLLAFYLGLAVISLVWDFGLTFVTPALAFTTRSAREALSTGLRMIRSEWPRAALYVLVPPLAILLIAQLVPLIATYRHLGQNLESVRAGRHVSSISTSLRLLSGFFAAVASLIGLVSKGATAAFYARRQDVPPYGASSASQDPLTTPPRPD